MRFFLAFSFKYIKTSKENSIYVCVCVCFFFVSIEHWSELLSIVTPYFIRKKIKKDKKAKPYFIFSNRTKSLFNIFIMKTSRKKIF